MRSSRSRKGGDAEAAPRRGRASRSEPREEAGLGGRIAELLARGVTGGAREAGLAGTEAAATLLGEARQRVGAVRELLGERAERREAEARDELDRLKAKDPRKLARKDPALRARIPAAVERSSARVERVTKLRAFHQESLAQVERDLDALLQTLRIPGAEAPGPAAPQPPAGRSPERTPRKVARPAAPQRAAEAAPARAPRKAATAAVRKSSPNRGR